VALTESTNEVLRPRLLRIPDYQRGYAWEGEHVSEFIDDLTLLEVGKRHYTGTVVLLGAGDPVVDDDSNSLAPVDVVDGQQRLTTICLLLNEIRLSFQSLGEEQMAAGIRRNFLLIEMAGVLKPKLRLGDGSNAVWVALLKDEPIPAVETLAAKRLVDSRKLLRAFVEKAAAVEDPKAALSELRDKVLNSLHFTRYNLDAQSDVGVIFETLNDRGKPLTELEKAKNYFLFLSARLPSGPQAELANRINTAWAQVYRYLLEVARVSSAGEDQFLRAHWLALVDPHPRDWKGTRSIKKRFARERYLDAPEKLSEEVGHYVDSLARAARAYADSLRPDVQAFADFGDQAAAARTIHARLARANTVAVFQPLMIALREKSPTDGAAYVRVLDMCLRFAVRAYVIGGYRADAGLTRLYRIAHEWYVDQSETGSIEWVVDALRRLVVDYASDSYVKQALCDREFNWYAWRSLKFFLYEYELHLNKGARPDVDYAFFEKATREKTVEHILPQTPSSYWNSLFTPAERKSLVNNLGNLVLTRDNSSYGNKAFPDKRGAAGPGELIRPCYAQSPLRQEQELATEADWTPEHILARQEALAEWAVEYWAVDAAGLDSGDNLTEEDVRDADDLSDNEGLTVAGLLED
jgi:hypothetical protein